MNNIEKLIKIKKFESRVRELFERKYSRADWENNVNGTKQFYIKCRQQAAKEIFNA